MKPSFPCDGVRPALARIATLSLLALVLGGCLVVPVPEKGLAVTRRWKKSAAALVTKATPRHEVVSFFGLPQWDFVDLGIIGYQWTGIEWGIIWEVWPPYGGGGGGHEQYSTSRHLWLAFNEQDRLVAAKVERVRPSMTPWEQALEWRSSLSSNTIPPRTFLANAPLAEGATVYCIWDKGAGSQKVLPVWIDGRMEAHIRRGYFTKIALGRGRHQIAVFANPLSLELEPGQTRFLVFSPDPSRRAAEEKWVECSDAEGRMRLQGLQFCR